MPDINIRTEVERAAEVAVTAQMREPADAMLCVDVWDSYGERRTLEFPDGMVPGLRPVFGRVVHDAVGSFIDAYVASFIGVVRKPSGGGKEIEFLAVVGATRSGQRAWKVYEMNVSGHDVSLTSSDLSLDCESTFDQVFEEQDEIPTGKHRWEDAQPRARLN